MVTNEWKKDGGKWFYLDDDGAMVTDQWVEDDYYVGEDGAMITNGWVKALADDEDVDSPEDTGEHWYYFNAKGKKITNSKKTIGGKTYHFDEDGKMLSGWQDDNSGNVYYLGGEDEGWETRNTWRWLEKSSLDDDEDDDVTGKDVLGCTDDDNDDCDDEGWYWFDNSGKLYHKSGLKTIKGKKFYFNEHGQMLYEWIYGAKKKAGSYAQLDSDSLKGATTADMMWFQENGDGASNGARYKGWQYLSGSEALGTDGDTNWYYFKDGKPKYADKDNGLTDGDDLVYRKKEKLSWDGKTGTFCFDQKGKMKTGLQYIEGHTYFFNDDGYMQTGKVSNVEEADGDTFNYYFNTKNSGKGQGYTGEKDGYLYFQGKRLEADDDYRLYYVNGNYYVVNSKGKCQKTFKKKDLELPNGSVVEDATIADIGKKNYVITSQVVTTTDEKVSYNVEDIAAIPHLHLDDTDEIITPFGIDEASEYKDDFLVMDDFVKPVNVDVDEENEQD
jgi:glucan-binding YG repeat protein